MKIKNLEFIKTNLYFLSQLSRDHLYIKVDDGNVHFLNTNKERTIIADFSLNDVKNKENFSFKLGTLFYDIFSRIEKGSEVYLDFNKNRLICNIRYENIEFKSVLNSQKANFKNSLLTKLIVHSKFREKNYIMDSTSLLSLKVI